MPLLTVYMNRIYCAVTEMRPWVVFTAILAYLAVSWGLLVVAGEKELTEDPVIFIYFSATVASTVGFGDFSPANNFGRVIMVLWFYPASLSLYAVFLAKVSAFLIEKVRRNMNGQGSYASISGATVIVGYHADRTKKMVQELLAGRDGDEDIILVSKREFPEIPEGVRFIRTERLDSVEALRRASCEKAAKVIIYADSDSETFNSCFALRELNETVHVAAYFQDEATAKRAEKLADVETVLSNSADILVRAAQDPGAAKILMALGSASFDATVYADEVPISSVGAESQLERVLNERDATLLAYKRSDMDCPKFRPFPQMFMRGTVVYYVAKSRLPKEVWDRFSFEQSSASLKKAG